MAVDELQVPVPEIVQLYTLYQEWSSSESGTLELDENGAGGIRMCIHFGDSSRDDLVVHWNSLAEGIAVLRREIDEHRPGARKFNEENCPHTRQRLEQRRRQAALARHGIKDVTKNTPEH